MTTTQFYAYRDYAYRSRQETLLGHYNFGNGKWNPPGIIESSNPNSEKSKLEKAILEYKAATGKKIITITDYEIIKREMEKDSTLNIS